MGWDLLSGKTSMRKKLMLTLWMSKSQAVRMEESSFYGKQSDEVFPNMLFHAANPATTAYVILWGVFSCNIFIIKYKYYIATFQSNIM